MMMILMRHLLRESSVTADVIVTRNIIRMVIMNNEYDYDENYDDAIKTLAERLADKKHMC
jgi:hypothetical protein